jgi:hypothetical protein
MSLAIFVLLKILYCFIGAFEAIYYHFKREYFTLCKNSNNNEYKRWHRTWLYNNDKRILVLIRCVIWYISFGYLGLSLTVSTMFIFPIIHDGFYYITRNELNELIYRKRFRADGPEDTSCLRFDWKNRVIFAGLGVVCLILSFFIKW